MTYSCTDFVDSIVEKLKIDIPEGFNDSPEAQADICCDEIGKLQDFALNVRRAIDTCRDDRDFNGLVERIQDLTDKLQDNLAGDTMVEQPAVFDNVAEAAQ